MAFNKSFQNVDPAFLDTVPTGSRYHIWTSLKNVILNGIIVYIKHFERIEFILEKEADMQLYFLDVLTPAPVFVGLEKPQTHIPGSKRQKASTFYTPLNIQLVDSDGEVEDVELAL